MDITEARVVGTLSSSQIELAWGTAIALIGAGLFVFTRSYPKKDWTPSTRFTATILIISLLCQIGSLVCGYLAVGGLVSMAEDAANNKNAWEFFEASQLMAGWQAILLLIGFVILLVAVFSNVRTLANNNTGGERVLTEASVPDAESAKAVAAAAVAATASANAAAGSAEAALQHKDAAKNAAAAAQKSAAAFLEPTPHEDGGTETEEA